MASSTPHTITLSGGNSRRELLAGGTIKPGHLLAVSSGAVIAHGTADGGTLKYVALENPTEGSDTTANIDVAYASGDTVYFAQGQPGDVFYMWLTTSNNAVVDVSPLVSTGDGALKVATLGATTLEGAIVGYPAESLNNTTGSDARLKVRIV